MGLKAADPDHYKRDGLECIDTIAVVLGKNGYQSYLTGNIFKYLWRMGDANRDVSDKAADAAKAATYAGWLAESCQTDENGC